MVRRVLEEQSSLRALANFIEETLSAGREASRAPAPGALPGGGPRRGRRGGGRGLPR